MSPWLLSDTVPMVPLRTDNLAACSDRPMAVALLIAAAMIIASGNFLKVV